MEERQHGDTLEHHHEGYEYWHPASRVHSEQPDGGLPIGHILAPVVQCSEECSCDYPVGQDHLTATREVVNGQEVFRCGSCGKRVEMEPRGLQVKPFDWAAWDQGCEAKGICQGYTTKKVYYTDNDEDWHQPPTYREELHHRNVAPDCIGLAEAYWQCPHCRQLQKPIHWIQGARLETYYVEVRGNRTVVWVKVSSGAWFVLVICAEGSLQGVAMGICQGTVYFCGIPDVSEAPPLQLPDECSTILARRMWHKLTKGYWSDRNKEDC